MGLVLTRKKGEVIVLDDELFIEVDGFLDKNHLQVYIYNKLKDTEHAYDLYKVEDNELEISWNKKKVFLSLSTNNKRKGKNQVQLVLDAAKSIIITRSSKIEYLHCVDNFQEDEHLYEINEVNKSNKEEVKEDLLVDRYKEELSWFFN